MAQLGALELRKRLLQGDPKALQDLRLGSQITVMEMLKIMAKLPPISALQLCNKQFGDWITEHVLQNGDDLDFVQEVVSATSDVGSINQSRNESWQTFLCGRNKDVSNAVN